MIKNRIVHYASVMLWVVSLSACTTLDSNQSPQSSREYEYTLSSGLFSLPLGAASVDWAIVNNSSAPQEFRVTVYRFDESGKSPVTPGPLNNTLKPSHTFHNANSVGYQEPFSIGRDYEVIIEVNSLKVLPSVEVWSDRGNTVIPGTLIGPGQFVDISD